VATLLLLIFLPLSFRGRSPADYWLIYVLASAGTALLLFNIYSLKMLWKAKIAARIGLYLTSGVVLVVLILLIQNYRAERQGDYEAHGGVGLYQDHPPTWR
jgi:hypothetical protein